MDRKIRLDKILIADDEEANRKLLSEKLKQAGYQCIEACYSAEVMNQIALSQPDLVILDIMMPGKPGHELLPEIIQSHPGTAVIMSTAIVDPRIITRCMKAGAQDYITKPYDLEEIVNSVTSALDVKRIELKIAEYQKKLENTPDVQKKITRDIFLNSIETMVYALEVKDKYTAGHARRVAAFSFSIGDNMRLTNKELEDLRWGSLLHDIGKIAVDKSIQNKPGSLSAEEYRHMMTHTIVGSSIAAPLANQKTIEIIMHHHDHYDGKALDQKTKGENIPLGARIVAVADCFDAMTSDRPYRSALSLEKAIDEIRQCSGTQFDPRIVDVFLALPIQQIVNSNTETSHCNPASLLLPV